MNDGLRFILYIDGQSARSLVAQENLVSLCHRHLGDDFTLDVLDVAKDPAIAVKEQIVALPTLEIHRYGRIQRLVGDLSLAQTVITAIGMGEEARRMSTEARKMLAELKAKRTETPTDGHPPRS